MTKLPGIDTVAFDLRSRVATVTFDARLVSVTEIEAAIDAARLDMADTGQQEEQMGRLLDGS